MCLIKEDKSTIDKLNGKAKLIEAHKTLLEKVPLIKRETSFCRRLSDIFESNPRRGFLCHRKFAPDDPRSGYGFSLNWLFPVNRLHQKTTTVEGELNLPNVR
jgi:hypothetical protein